MGIQVYMVIAALVAIAVGLQALGRLFRVPREVSLAMTLLIELLFLLWISKLWGM